MESAGSRAGGTRGSLEADMALELQSVRELYSGLAPSLAPDGIFIELDEPAAPGSEVAFRVTLPGGVMVLEGSGIVMWSRDDDDDQGPAGMAVRFGPLSPSARETIAAVVDAHLASGGEVFDLGGHPAEADAFPTDALSNPAARLGPGRWTRRPAGAPPDPGAAPADRRPLLFRSPAAADAIDRGLEEMLHRLAPASADGEPARGGERVGADEIPDILDRWKREVEVGGVEPGRSARAAGDGPVDDRVAGEPLRLPFEEATSPEGADGGGLPLASSSDRGTPPWVRRPWRWWLVGAGAVALLAVTLVALWPAPPLTRNLPAEVPGARRPLPSGRVAKASPEIPPPPAAAVAAAPSGSSVPAAPAARVRSISWRSRAGATEVVIEADGALEPARVDALRLDAPPRILVRVRGIEAPYTPYRLEVGSPELAAIRVGHHPELEPPTLYVVLDLASPEPLVLEGRVEGVVARVVVGRADD